MNKNIIAGAILAALSTAAAAQSSVTVYGLVDAGINYDSSAVNGLGNKSGLTSGNTAGSRIGFRGQEDLGNGLSAIFTLENGFDVSNGAETHDMFGRQAFVGLKGNFGTVKLGRQYTAFDTVLAASDAFASGLNGRAANLVSNANGFTGQGYAVRSSDTIKFETANYSGFTGSLAYGFGEQQGDSKANRFIGVSAEYKNDALYVGAAYQEQRGAVNTQDKRKDAIIGAGYDFGVAKLNGFYSQAKAEAAAGEKKEKSYGLSVAAPFGAHKVLASVTQVKSGNTGDNGKATQYGLGYTYDLSKRTSVYASYARITNSNGAALTVGTAMHVGTGASGAAIGIRHAF